VASLWSISDLATLAVSVVFCQGLRAGLTVPQALRAAMQAVRKADVATLDTWGEAVRAGLPYAGHEPFSAAQLVEIWAAFLTRRQRNKSSCAALIDWAPYITIGWPGPVSSISHVPNSTELPP